MWKQVKFSMWRAVTNKMEYLGPREIGASSLRLAQWVTEVETILMYNYLWKLFIPFGSWRHWEQLSIPSQSSITHRISNFRSLTKYLFTARFQHNWSVERYREVKVSRNAPVRGWTWTGTVADWVKERACGSNCDHTISRLQRASKYHEIMKWFVFWPDVDYSWLFIFLIHHFTTVQQSTHTERTLMIWYLVVRRRVILEFYPNFG